MLLIPLTQGQFAKVDDASFEQLTQWNWYAHWNIRTQTFYAQRTHKKKVIHMHRFLLNLGNRRDIQVDHINRDTLDNQKSNLRTATQSENRCNIKVYRNNILGVKGVRLHKSSGRWEARIQKNKIPIYLGSVQYA